MKSSSRFFLMALTCLAVCSAQPAISTVLNGASYSAVLSPGSWVVVFGSNLAPGTATAQETPLPLKLGGVSVTVAGMPAPLLYVSSTQLNVLIPIEVSIPSNTVVPLVVTSASGSSTYNIRLMRDAPGLFTTSGTGTGAVIAFDSGFRSVSSVAAQDTVSFYATGLGPTSASDGLNRVVDDVEVYIGERKAQVLFAGLAPGFPGIYQLNVVAPAPATDRVYIRSGGWQSNIVNIGINAGANASNVTGSIDGLNPSSDASYPSKPQRPCVGDNDPGPCGPTGFSESMPVVLHAGTFRVSLDITPNAGPFDVAAVDEAGAAIITIDPQRATYSAAFMAPSSRSRIGDFSGSINPLWDFPSCDWKTAICLQFQNGTIPANRLMPFWLHALQMVPTPNTTATGSPNGLLQMSGPLGGSHFDSQIVTGLSTFGGFVQVPYGPFPAGVSTFKLYVDGRVIASKDLPYLLYNRAPVAATPDQ